MNKEEKREVRSIHYLGSKLRMLDSIEKALLEVVNAPGAICDLFSGSGTVSKYLLHTYDVISIDIQEYSKVLCEASTSFIDLQTSVDILIENIKGHPMTSEITDAFKSLIIYEKECLESAGQGSIPRLYEIIEHGSLYIYEHEKLSDLSKVLGKAIKTSLDKLYSN